LIPIAVAPGQTKGSVRVVEQSPSRVTLTIWDDRVPELLKQVLEQPSLDANARAALEPIVELRVVIGRLDTEIEGLQTQQRELDERANEERQNLLAIQKDPRAAALRARVNTRLEELTREAQTLGRRIVELGSQRLERKIELEDKLRTLDLTAPPSSQQPIRVM
jgi:chromosome segregation ATPase